VDALAFRIVNEFFAALGRRWAEGAAKRGAKIAAPELEPALAEEILQLARVVAHSKERSFAPLASFTAGVAVERFRAAKETDPASVAAYVREVREALEREGSTSG
jgi:predicted oxidoreductase